jgi:hypothetical protein
VFLRDEGGDANSQQRDADLRFPSGQRRFKGTRRSNPRDSSVFRLPPGYVEADTFFKFAASQ